MLIAYDKDKIKQALSEENIFEVLTELGGNPTWSNGAIVSDTICHNCPGCGSHKLYYYTNSKLLNCYTGCATPSFDIFELVIKCFKLQYDQEIDLNEAVRWVAGKFGLYGTVESNGEEESEDWSILASYDRIKKIEIKSVSDIQLKEYDINILDRMNYNIKLKPWLEEGISQEVLNKARIGYYLGGDQITIPHFDKDGRFIGLRGRTMSKEDGERYGKYRPLMIQGKLYNHPLGFNLYGFNWAKENIKAAKKAIIFESEKSTLKYISLFGEENNIAVACCGSNISNYQMQLLMDAGVEEVIIAFDRQFQKIGDKEFIHLKENLLKIRERYKNSTIISFIFDKKMITEYKNAPIDEGKEKFLKLFKERIVL